MSLWRLVHCKECGWKAERLLASEADLAMQGCTHCGRKALEFYREPKLKRRAPKSKGTPLDGEAWLHWALQDAGLER